MIETALLCFFIYGPILMMVVVLGDVTLERQQQQVAAAYQAWAPEEIATQDLRTAFFPDADTSMGSGSIYTVTGSSDENEDAPAYIAASPTGEDDKNIWVKLQIMAVGEWWSSLEWQVVDGMPQLVTVVHRSMDSDAKYLTQNEIVPAVDLPTNFNGITEGANIDFNWGGPTERARVVTNLLNHDFGDSPPPPLLEPHASLAIWHTSVFFDDLDRYRFGNEEYSFDLPRSNDTVGLDLTVQSVPDEGVVPTTQVGKVWLFNPECKPSAADARRNLYDLAPGLFSYNTGNGVYVTIRDMPRPLSTIGGSPEEQRPFRFVQPGDPRLASE